MTAINWRSPWFWAGVVCGVTFGAIIALSTYVLVIR